MTRDVPPSCPACSSWSIVLLPSLARCTADSCQVETYRLDRPSDERTLQTVIHGP